MDHNRVQEKATQSVPPAHGMIDGAVTPPASVGVPVQEKKNIVASYVAGITDVQHGESYSTILRYFIPEYITCIVIYSMPFWLDAYFISHLKSTATYGVLGATNNLLHFIIKVAEALSVGTLILSGRHNGMSNFAQAGRALRDAFWVTCTLGLFVASILFFGAHHIYSLYVPDDMVAIGVPFLRSRAVGVFLMFVAFAFMGFLRGVKNTKTPMHIFVLGAVTFVFFDYALVLGNLGFPALGLQGSALASALQYAVMCVAVIICVLKDKKYHKYGIHLFAPLQDGKQCKELLRLSWPVLLDKATMAFSYVWLCAMTKPLGSCGVATFCVLKDMERFALVPAIAFAQVSTLLVSNDFGIGNWRGIKSNIKKILLLAACMVFGIMVLFALKPDAIIRCFDRKAEFTDLAARVFPILSILAFFDLVQLILSGALRGAANVRVVMYARLVVSLCYFVPVSYLLAHVPMQDAALKLLLIYGAFYLGNGLMSIVYVYRFRGQHWNVV